MKRVYKLGCVLALTGVLVYQTTQSSNASSDRDDTPQVTADGVTVHAGLNTSDPALDGVVEGSVTFMANVPFQKVLENMQKPGTFGKISPNVQNYTATKVTDDDNAIVYKISEEIVPFKLPLIEMAPSKVNLEFTINKRAFKDRMIAVTYNLDPTANQDSKWLRLSGRIYGCDLNNGYSMFMIASSSKSKYPLPSTTRIKLVKQYLSKTKDNVVSWLNGL